MKISVIIPAYNCEATIQATLDSVLRQTLPPDEILVMDDGSTDGTASILHTYGPRIRAFRQENQGVACAFNALCQRAQGDLVAFVGSDDIWHPNYLEVQRKLFEAHPSAVAFFTGHVNFRGDGDYKWRTNPLTAPFQVEVIPPLEFFKRYNKATGPFACFTYCCIPKNVLTQLGPEPFSKERAAEDSYCCYLLSLLGPVVYSSAPLAAYRVRAVSLSSNHLWIFGVWVHIFEILEDRFRTEANPELRKAFKSAFAAKRRSYSKHLMGAERTVEAREQLLLSLGNSSNPASVTKSLAMLGATCLPKALQPAWLPSQRVLTTAEEDTPASAQKSEENA